MPVVVIILAVFVLSVMPAAAQPRGFVTASDGRLMLDKKPYYFIGANYWYGPLLGLEKDKRRGIGRLRRELDLLKQNGVTNLRLLAGAEGSGELNGVVRVGPPLQPVSGKFDTGVLQGLDLVLAEMEKRQMKAVIYLSNNWEWSGGFQQYLIWSGRESREWLAKKPSWDELRDLVAKFYSCTPCMAGYREQAAVIINRTNTITKRRYIDDPTIMAWEIANEPRPMWPAANDAYRRWLAAAAADIRRRDPHHLITTGHEGRIGTESLDLFEQVHADPNIGYLTIHIWPRNWGWYEKGDLAGGYEKAADMSAEYIDEHIAVARKLGKPLVIEEFGLPRDGSSFDINGTTALRDKYFALVFSYVRREPAVAGAAFWAFGGSARPVKGRLFWRAGDEYMGDPPMEEQGLYTVFDIDRSTWQVIRSAARRTAAPAR